MSCARNFAEHETSNTNVTTIADCFDQLVFIGALLPFFLIAFSSIDRKSRLVPLFDLRPYSAKRGAGGTIVPWYNIVAAKNG